VSFLGREYTVPKRKQFNPTFEEVERRFCYEKKQAHRSSIRRRFYFENIDLILKRLNECYEWNPYLDEDGIKNIFTGLRLTDSKLRLSQLGSVFYRWMFNWGFTEEYPSDEADHDWLDFLLERDGEELDNNGCETIAEFNGLVNDAIRLLQEVADCTGQIFIINIISDSQLLESSTMISNSILIKDGK
jgi:hypothetical protein